MPPATAADAKNMARKSRPLPTNTVEKNRSSCSPSRSRATPMNQRKAIPAKGARLRASDKLPALADSHAPSSAGSSGMASRMSTMLALNSAANAIPAIAAARGVRSARPGEVTIGSDIAPSASVSVRGMTVVGQVGHRAAAAGFGMRS